MNNKSFISFTILFAIGTFISKISGLIRQQYILYLFSKSWHIDILSSSIRVVNLLRELLAEGALVSAFVPIFIKILSKDKEKAKDFAGQSLSIFFIISFIIATLIIYYADYAMIYNSSNQSAKGYEISKYLFQIFMIYIPIVSVSSIYMGVLNSFNKFHITAISPLIINLIFIISVYIVYNKFNLGIISCGIGLVISGALYILVQIYSMITIPFHFYPRFPYFNDDTKLLIKTFIPYSLSVGISKFNNVISVVFAIKTLYGITALSYAFFTIQLPISIFIVGISNVILTSLSFSIFKSNIKEFEKLIILSIEIILIFTIPSTIGLLSLNTEITNLLFNYCIQLYNNGYSTKVELINKIVVSIYYYSPMIISVSINIILIRVLQVLNKSKVLIFSSIMSLVLNYVLTWICINILKKDFYYIAIVTTITSSINLLILFLFIKLYTNIQFNKIIYTLRNSIISSLIMYVFIHIIKSSNLIYQNTIIKNIFSIIMTIIISALLYMSILFLLNEKHIKNIRNYFK